MSFANVSDPCVHADTYLRALTKGKAFAYMLTDACVLLQQVKPLLTS